MTKLVMFLIKWAGMFVMFCQVHLNGTSLRRGLFSFVVLNVSMTVVFSKQVSRDQASFTSYHDVHSVFTEF